MNTYTRVTSRFPRIRITQKDYEALPGYPPNWYPPSDEVQRWRAVANHVEVGKAKTCLVASYRTPMPLMSEYSATARRMRSMWFRPTIVMGPTAKVEGLTFKEAMGWAHRGYLIGVPEQLARDEHHIVLRGILMRRKPTGFVDHHRPTPDHFERNDWEVVSW